MITVKLTSAQVSALECRDGGGLDPITERAWKGRQLVFEKDEASALSDELTEASNGEGEQAELYSDKAARGAAVALGNLSLKVAKLSRIE